MNRLKLTIAYDGTDFHGWQFQPNQPSVQSALAQAFEKKFRQGVKILGASRTDAEVHAAGQIALAQTKLYLDHMVLQKAWNQALPESISILSVESAPEGFHPFFRVVQKIYTYDLFTQRPMPEVARFGWHHKHVGLVDWSVFEATLQLFVGDHDFSQFCRFDPSEGRSAMRSVEKISVQRDPEQSRVRITFFGKGFLRYQIRRMIGTALAMACWKGFDSEDIKKSLCGQVLPKGKIPTFSAAGKGLTLRKIVYS